MTDAGKRLGGDWVRFNADKHKRLEGRLAQAGNGSPGKAEESVPWGVPLGGIGAGCIELGGDGRFRNITINNNRDTATRIDLAPGAFLAVRAVRQGKVQTRFLQPGCNLPFPEAGIIPNFTPAKQLAWRGLYPCSMYALQVPEFPVATSWQAMSPIIPHDLPSSTLPAMFVAMTFVNTGKTPVQVSALFNWENLCGCTRGRFPEKRGVSQVAPLQEGTPVKPAGLAFGEFERFETNATGNYALLALPQPNVETSVMVWNEQDPQELDVFWQRFHYEGRLGNEISRNPASHSAAVCNTLEVPPGETRRVVFALAWYCPRFEVDGVDQGNIYANQFKNAVEVAWHAVRNARYLFNAVDAWQQRFTASSLPRWLTRMLLNSSSVLSTNTLMSAAGRYTMFESPDDPWTGCADRRFYSSIGTLLLFPQLEESELLLFGKAFAPQAPGRICRVLGRMCAEHPGPGPTPDELMDINAKFVLMVCRNYLLTGRRQFLDAVFPKLTQAMDYVLSHDRDGDGLPEQSGCSTTFEGIETSGVNSYTAGLWLAAIRAYARVATLAGRKDEVDRFKETFRKGLETYERLLWDEQRGYYRLNAGRPEGTRDTEAADEACHTGQLAGEWYAEWLCLGKIFEPGRIRRALEAIQRHNSRRYGLVEVAPPRPADAPEPEEDWDTAGGEFGWPALDAAHYCCLLMQNRRADHGLYFIERVYKGAHLKGGRTFNAPKMWDPVDNTAGDKESDRHMSALSYWHVLCSLQGFLLDMTTHAVWIRPNLPLGVHFLNAPVITPATLGWLRFLEDDKEGYRLQTQVTFEQAVLVAILVVRVPDEVEDVAIQLATPASALEARYEFRRDGNERLLSVIPEKPVVVREGITLGVRQTRGAAKAFRGGKAPARQGDVGR